MVDRPDSTRYYVHPGESTSSYQWVTTRVQFMFEMMKFFPKFEQIGYAGEPPEDFTVALREFGHAEGEPFVEGLQGDLTLHHHDDGSWHIHDPNGIENSLWDGGTPPGRGYTYDNFGAWHRTPDPNPALGRLPWGTLKGNVGTNFDWHPSVSTWNHFKGDDQSSELNHTTSLGASIDDPIATTYYRNVTGGYGYSTTESYADFWTSPKTLSADGDSEIVIHQGIQNVLQSFGNRSIYQIIMSPFASGAGGTIKVYDTKNTDDQSDDSLMWDGHQKVGNGDGVVNGQRVEWGNMGSAVYESLGDEGAFELMAGLLESRRRIFAGMTDLFGGVEHIRHVDGDGYLRPEDQAMIATMENWMNDSASGIDPHNPIILSTFLYLQHSFDSVFGATVGSGEHNGWLLSGKDQLAFKRFADWLSTHTQNYVDHLGSLESDAADADNDELASAIGNFQTRAQHLRDEYFGTSSDTQPYLEEDNWDRRTGWDFYTRPGSGNWDTDGDGHTGPGPYLPPDSSLPPNLNPYAANPHPNYAQAQIEGPWSMVGERLGYQYADGSYLAHRNWMAHHVFTLLRFGDRDVSRVMTINIRNRAAHRQFKKDMEDYYETKTELQQEEARQQAQARQRVTEHKADIQKSAAAKQKWMDDMKKAQAGAVDHRISLRIAQSHQQSQKIQSRKVDSAAAASQARQAPQRPNNKKKK